jgi:hypothetical protein
MQVLERTSLRGTDLPTSALQRVRQLLEVLLTRRPLAIHACSFDPAKASAAATAWSCGCDLDISRIFCEMTALVFPRRSGICHPFSNLCQHSPLVFSAIGLV